MNAQMNRSGHWGPVTATLDWCEVRISFPHRRVSSPFTFLSGKLPVLTLRGGNFQHHFQSLSHLRIDIRRTSVMEGGLANSLSHRIYCSSLCAHHPSFLPPTRYVANHPRLSFQGCALIGLGSFCFHATLLYEAQLADELPMIYLASFLLLVLLESEFGVRPELLIVLFTAMCIGILCITNAYLQHS
jgi:hypothetical protein